MTAISLTTREHIAWCRGRGMTPGDVCESVNAFLSNPTWWDAQEVIEQRWRQLCGGVEPLPIITDRRVQ